jgi:hypothetical protein
LGSIILLDGLGLIYFLYFWVGVGWISKLLDLGIGGCGLDYLPLAVLLAAVTMGGGSRLGWKNRAKAEKTNGTSDDGKNDGEREMASTFPIIDFGV